MLLSIKDSKILLLIVFHPQARICACENEIKSDLFLKLRAKQNKFGLKGGCGSDWLVVVGGGGWWWLRWW